MKINFKISKSAEIAKSHYVMPFSYCFVVIALYFTINYYFRYDSVALGVCCFIASILGLTIQWVVNYFKSYVLVANYIVSLLFFVIFSISFFSGGIKASSIWWIGLAPVVAAFLLNATYSILWLIVISIEIIILYFLKNYDLLPASPVMPSQTNQFLITSTLTGIYIITILSILTEIMREKVFSANVELQNEAFRLNQLASIGTLASGMAHEINNPLTVISVSRLKLKNLLEGDKGYDKDKVEKYLDMIERSAKKINEVVYSMNLLSGADLGKRDGNINVKNLFSLILDAGIQKIGSNKISIELNKISENLYINGAYKDIQKAIFNIVENAIEELSKNISNQKTIKITVVSEANNLIVFISDNGRGVEENLREKIFNPFFTTSEIGKGRGLGLYFSLNVITSIGGTLQLIENDQPNGSCFKIVLPVSFKS